MFKYRCECEYCGHEELLDPTEVDMTCPACGDTGDDRTNEEKYGCRECEHYKGNNKCALEFAWLIDDINCPKETK